MRDVSSSNYAVPELSRFRQMNFVETQRLTV